MVTAEISNVGKGPISSESFSRERGLTFHLTRPILKVLTVEHKPTSAPAPSIVASDNNFELRPELIVPNEIIKVSMLTEGQVGDVGITLNPFGEVKVETRDREVWLRQRARWGFAALVSGLGVLLAITIAITVIDINKANSTDSQANTVLNNVNQVLVAGICSDIVSAVGGARVPISLVGTILAPPGKGNYLKTDNQAFSLTIKNEVSIIRSEAAILSSAYSEAQGVHLPLKGAANVAIMLTKASDTLARLKSGVDRAAIDSGIIDANNAVHALNSEMAIPPGCRH